jgi:hypothetical protein
VWSQCVHVNSNAASGPSRKSDNGRLRVVSPDDVRLSYHSFAAAIAGSNNCAPSGGAATIAAIAKRDRQQVSHVGGNRSLAFLAPDITETFPSGRQSATLRPERLKAAWEIPLAPGLEGTACPLGPRTARPFLQKRLYVGNLAATGWLWRESRANRSSHSADQPSTGNVALATDRLDTPGENPLNPCVSASLTLLPLGSRRLLAPQTGNLRASAVSSCGIGLSLSGKGLLHAGINLRQCGAAGCKGGKPLRLGDVAGAVPGNRMA